MHICDDVVHTGMGHSGDSLLATLQLYIIIDLLEAVDLYHFHTVGVTPPPLKDHLMMLLAQPPYQAEVLWLNTGTPPATIVLFIASV